MKKILLTLLVLVAIAAGLLYSILGDNKPLNSIAQKLPDEAIGMLFIKAPKESLNQLISALEGEKMINDKLDEFRDDAEYELGFDPLDIEALEENTGIDLSKDLFVTVRGLDSKGEPDIIGGIGVSDLVKLKDFVEKVGEKNGEELEVEIEEKDGIEYATTNAWGSEEGIAYDGSHIYVGVNYGRKLSTIDVLEDFMDGREKATLASNPLYKEAAGKIGNLPISGFINLVDLVDAMPERELNGAPDFITDKDLEAIAFGFGTHDAEFALSFAEDADALELIKSGESVTSMFKRMNKPIIAASVSLDDPYAALELFVKNLDKGEQKQFEQGKQQILNILELDKKDAQEILKGAAIGLALFDFSINDPEFIVFVRLNDDEQELEDEVRKLMRRQISPEQEEIDDYELYNTEIEGFSISFTVIDEYFVFGDTGSVSDLARGEVSNSWSPSVGKGLASLYIDSLKANKIYTNIMAMSDPQVGKLLKAIDIEEHYEQYENTASVVLDGRTLRGTFNADIKTTGKYESDIHFLADLLGDLAKSEEVMRELQYMF